MYGINSQLSTVNCQLSTLIFKSHILVGIFPGSQHLTKQYPIERIVNFLLEIPSEWNCKFLIMGDWKDKHHAIHIKTLSELKIFDLTGAFNIGQMIAAISLCDIILTNDSGPMHIAAALKKPQIAIFGATHPKLGFRPLNTKAITLQANIRCQPCSLHGGKSCRRSNLYCFRNIPSTDVFEKFNILYDELMEL